MPERTAFSLRKEGRRGGVLSEHCEKRSKKEKCVAPGKKHVGGKGEAGVLLFQPRREGKRRGSLSCSTFLLGRKRGPAFIFANEGGKGDKKTLLEREKATDVRRSKKGKKGGQRVKLIVERKYGRGSTLILLEKEDEAA